MPINSLKTIDGRNLKDSTIYTFGDFLERVLHPEKPFYIVRFVGQSGNAWRRIVSRKDCVFGWGKDGD
jgi:hypothetical protein